MDWSNVPLVDFAIAVPDHRRTPDPAVRLISFDICDAGALFEPLNQSVCDLRLLCNDRVNGEPAGASGVTYLSSFCPRVAGTFPESSSGAFPDMPTILEPPAYPPQSQPEAKDPTLRECEHSCCRKQGKQGWRFGANAQKRNNGRSSTC